MDLVLIILGTQVIKKKRPVRSVFPDYIFFSYDYVQNQQMFSFQRPEISKDSEAATRGVLSEKVFLGHLFIIYIGTNGDVTKERK